MESILSFDYTVLAWIAQNLVSAPLTALMRFITGLGDNGMIWILIGVCCLISPKTRRYGVSMLIALLLSLICNNLILKSLVARARPFLQYPSFVPLISPPGGYSFPSGHSSSSFAAAYACFKHHKSLGIILLILAALIAFSRLYVCVHFPSDVICGSLLGLVLGSIAFKLCTSIFNNLKR